MRGRGKAAGHHHNCPIHYDPQTPPSDDFILYSSENTEEAANRVQEAANALSNLSTKATHPPLPERFNTIEIGCIEEDPMHKTLHWTGCFIEDCRTHTDKRYEPKRPRGFSDCRYCGKYGHHEENCPTKLEDIEKKAAKAKKQVNQLPTCTYCRTKGHTRDKCIKRETDSLKLYNTIKNNATKREPSPSPNQFPHIGVITPAEALFDWAFPPKDDFRSTIKRPHSSSTAPQDNPLSDSELSEISSSLFQDYDHEEYLSSNPPGSSPPKAPSPPESPNLPTNSSPLSISTSDKENYTPEPVCWTKIDASWKTLVQKSYQDCPDFQLIAKYPQLHSSVMSPSWDITYDKLGQEDTMSIYKIDPEGMRRLCIPSNCRQQTENNDIQELRETLIQ